VSAIDHREVKKTCERRAKRRDFQYSRDACATSRRSSHFSELYGVRSRRFTLRFLVECVTADADIGGTRRKEKRLATLRATLKRRCAAATRARACAIATPHADIKTPAGLCIANALRVFDDNDNDKILTPPSSLPPLPAPRTRD